VFRGRSRRDDLFRHGFAGGCVCAGQGWPDDEASGSGFHRGDRAHVGFARQPVRRDDARWQDLQNLDGQQGRERETGRGLLPIARAVHLGAGYADKKDQIFAGTGPDGKVFHVSPDGKVEEWFTAEDSNILSLALDANGALLAGGSDRGLLFRITEKGKGVVLHEFAEDEVKALAVHGDDVYIGVNKQRVRRPRGVAARRPSAAEFEDLTQRLTGQFGAAVTPETAGPGRETPPEARLANLLAGTLYVEHADGRVDRLATWNDESILDVKVDGDGRCWRGCPAKAACIGAERPELGIAVCLSRSSRR
jgi:hypothetical protein